MINNSLIWHQNLNLVLAWEINVSMKINRPNSTTDYEDKIVLQKDYDEVGQNRRLEVLFSA